MGRVCSLLFFPPYSVSCPLSSPVLLCPLVLVLRQLILRCAGRQIFALSSNPPVSLFGIVRMRRGPPLRCNISWCPSWTRDLPWDRSRHWDEGAWWLVTVCLRKGKVIWASPGAGVMVQLSPPLPLPLSLFPSILPSSLPFFLRFLRPPSLTPCCLHSFFPSFPPFSLPLSSLPSFFILPFSLPSSLPHSPSLTPSMPACLPAQPTLGVGALSGDRGPGTVRPRDRLHGAAPGGRAGSIRVLEGDRGQQHTAQLSACLREGFPRRLQCWPPHRASR